MYNFVLRYRIYPEKNKTKKKNIEVGVENLKMEKETRQGSLARLCIISIFFILIPDIITWIQF